MYILKKMVSVNQKMMIKVAIVLVSVAVYTYSTQKKANDNAPQAPQETLGSKLKSLKFSGLPLGKKLKSLEFSGLPLGKKLKSLEFSGLPLGKKLKSLNFSGLPLGAPLKSLNFSKLPLGRIIGSDEEPLPKWIWGIVVTLVLFKIFEKPLQNLVEK